MRDNAKSGALTEVTFFILLSVFKPRHGYAIMQFVEEQTGGRLLLGAGSLYGALNSLTQKGWIEPVGQDADRKKQYRITKEGRRIAEGELVRLRELTKTAERIFETCPKTAVAAGEYQESEAGRAAAREYREPEASKATKTPGFRTWEGAGI